MAFLELATTAAGAEIIAACLGKSLGRFAILRGEESHDLCSGVSPPQQGGYDLHGPVNVMEESLVCCTQVVHTRLPIRRHEKPIFGTFTPAGKSDFALTAATGQCLLLVAAKLLLLT